MRIADQLGRRLVLGLMSILIAASGYRVVTPAAGFDDGFQARWAFQSTYIDAVPGQRTQLVMAFWNTGTRAWHRDAPGASVTLGSSEPLDNDRWWRWRTAEWPATSRIARLTTDVVAPGQLGWFLTSFVVPADAEVGLYRIHMRPVVDGVRWLDDYGAFHQIAVRANARMFSDSAGILVFGHVLPGTAGSGIVRLAPIRGGEPREIPFDVRPDGSYSVALRFGDSVGALASTNGMARAQSVPRDLYQVSVQVGKFEMTPTRATDLPVGSIQWPPPTPTPTRTPTPEPEPTVLGVITPPSVSPSATVTVPVPSTPTPSPQSPSPEPEPAPSSPTPTPTPTPTPPPPAGTTAPMANASSPASTSTSPFDVTVTYSDAESGVTSVELWESTPSSAAFSLVSSQSFPASPSGTLSFSYTPAAGGTYGFYAIGVDASGDRGPAPASAQTTTTFTAPPPPPPPPPADTTAPSSNVSGGTFGATAPSWTVTASASDDTALASVALYARAPGAGTYSLVSSQAVSGATASATFAYTPSGDGTHDLYTVATDAAGNVEAAPVAPDRSEIHDATAPTANASSPATASAAFDVTVSYSDATTGVSAVELWAKTPSATSFSLTSTQTFAASPSGTRTFSYTPGGDGSYGFYGIAVDAAGNRSIVPAGAQTTTSYSTPPPPPPADTTAPTSAASGGPASPTNTSSWTLGASASDDTALASVALYVRTPGAVGYSLVESKAASGTSASVTFTPYLAVSEGTYEFYAIATDAAGNVEASPAAADGTIVRDTTAPTASASSPASTSVSPFDVTVNYDDATTGVTSVELYAQPPGAGGFTLASTQSFASSLSGSRTFSYTPAAGDGTYGFYAIAVDAAGDRGIAPASAQTTTAYTQPDTIAPSSTATGGPASPTSTTTWTFGATATDTVALASVALYVRTPGAGAPALIESVPTTGTSATVTFAPYQTISGDGTYELHTVATDAAGNIEAPPASPDRTIVRDTTAPTATASSPAATNTSPITVTVAYSDATSGATTVELYAKAPGASSFGLVDAQTFAASLSGTRTFSYTPAAGQGSYAFAALAQDAAGNRGPTPAAAQSTTTYDTTAPNANSSNGAPPHGTPAGATATITVLFSEAIQCGGSATACAAQWRYRPSGADLWATGSNIVVAGDGRSAVITFVKIPDNVHGVHDRIRYDQSATAADRVKDVAGNDLTTGVELSPSNP